MQPIQENKPGKLNQAGVYTRYDREEWQPKADLFNGIKKGRRVFYPYERRNCILIDLNIFLIGNPLKLKTYPLRIFEF